METSTLEITQFYSDLVDRVVTHNLDYLSIIVVALLGIFSAAGAFFYIFNLKPIKEAVKKVGVLEENLNKLKASTEEEIKNQLRESTEDVKKIETDAKKEIGRLTKQYQELDFQTSWDSHYWWRALKIVQINELRSLVFTLDKIALYKMSHHYDLVINSINEFLVDRGRKMEKEDLDALEELFPRLKNAFTKMEGYDSLKEQIIKEFSKVLSELAPKTGTKGKK